MVKDTKLVRLDGKLVDLLKELKRTVGEDRVYYELNKIKYQDEAFSSFKGFLGLKNNKKRLF